jgi:hypothetical protein
MRCKGLHGDFRPAIVGAVVSIDRLAAAEVPAAGD